MASTLIGGITARRYDVKERPILFSAPMVRAILDGAKSQTRRIVKPQPSIEQRADGLFDGSIGLRFGFGCHSPTETILPWCPYGQPGDTLWVRETWQPCGLTELGLMQAAYYKADGHTYYDPNDLSKPCKWHPSIHMPRWASRITLEITGVRVERLHDINDADATAEGTPHSLYLPAGRTAVENYYHLWECINGDGSWDVNPWVWVIEFRKL